MPLLAITRQMDPPTIVERLIMAKNDQTTSLAFFQIEFDMDIAAATIDLFRHSFATSTNITTKTAATSTTVHRQPKITTSRRCGCFFELSLYGCTGYVEDVVQVALSLDLFVQITIKMVTVPLTLPMPMFWSLGSGMKFNLRLATLQLVHTTISKEQATYLGDGLKSLFGRTCLQQLSLSRVEFSSSDAIAEVAAGLQDNTSLQRLAIISCHLSDTEIATIAHALVGHPTVVDLRLFGNDCRKEGLKALSHVLAFSKVESLDLHHQSWRNQGLQSHIHLLFDGLGGNQHLKRLNLSSNILNDDDLESLAQIHWTCRQLEELDLDMNNFTNVGLYKFAHFNDIPSRLRRLRLAGNNFTREGAVHLLKILQVHLELGFVDCHQFWIRSDQRKIIQHFLDVNRCGRALLRQGNNFPLSLWPIVLAKANRVFFHYEIRRANALYLLLHGPALMQRADFGVPDGRNSSDRVSKKRKLGFSRYDLFPGDMPSKKKQNQ